MNAGRTHFLIAPEASHRSRALSPRVSHYSVLFAHEGAAGARLHARTPASRLRLSSPDTHGQPRPSPPCPRPQAISGLWDSLRGQQAANPDLRQRALESGRSRCWPRGASSEGPLHTLQDTHEEGGRQSGAGWALQVTARTPSGPKFLGTPEVLTATQKRGPKSGGARSPCGQEGVRCEASCLPCRLHAESGGKPSKDSAASHQPSAAPRLPLICQRPLPQFWGGCCIQTLSVLSTRNSFSRRRWR